MALHYTLLWHLTVVARSSRALDNGRAIRRIVCVAVHNLSWRKPRRYSVRCLSAGQAYSWTTLQEFLIGYTATRYTPGVNSQASHLYRACQLLMRRLNTKVLVDRVCTRH